MSQSAEQRSKAQNDTNSQNPATAVDDQEAWATDWTRVPAAGQSKRRPTDEFSSQPGSFSATPPRFRQIYEALSGEFELGRPHGRLIERQLAFCLPSQAGEVGIEKWRLN